MRTKTTARSTKHEALTQTLLDIAAALKPGDRFPSQSELMRRFQVSDRTVLRSLEDMRVAGWIVRRHGSGTFVADPGQRRQPVSALAPTTNTLAALALTFGPFYQYCVDRLSLLSEGRGLSLVCQHTRDEIGIDDVLPLEALNPNGFVLFNYHLIPIAKRLLERGHRVVLMGAPPADVYPEVPSVYGDHELGGWLASRHLIELGHRRLGFYCTNVRSPLDSSTRWKGHMRAIEEAERAGIPVSHVVHNHVDARTWSENPAAMAAYFRSSNAPTGIVAWNDSQAVELVRLLHNAGLDVPSELSVIGFDSLPMSEHCVPALTTIDQHIEIQLRAVMDLLHRVAEPPATQATIVVPTLVSRASCAPPRS